jgi:hypothetical protein
MRSVLWLVGVTALVGCERKAPEKRFEGPLPITFGDCAGAGTAWVSGPRPMPFTPADADAPWVGTESSAVAVAPPTPAPAAPQVPVAAAPAPAAAPASPEEAERARKEALEAARAAGVLGSTALAQGGAFASLIDQGDITGTFDESDLYGGLLGNEVGEMQGGFGFGMTGLGQGGTTRGWGTIGTGRYGTIGHGAGTGSGYGVGGRYSYRPRGGSNVPHVRIGQAQSQGDLDKAIIRRYVKRNFGKIQYCYEKQLVVNPKLAGTVNTEFFITPNGEVATSKAEGVDPSVSQCIAGVIKSIVFPKPKGGGGVQVRYPFTLQVDVDASVAAAGSGSAAGSADAGSASAAGSDSAGSASAGSTTAAGGAPTADKQRRLFRSTSLQAVPATPYRPGAANPLRSEQAALEACLRRADAPHAGIAVFELVYDGGGKVARASVHGIDDKQLAACMTTVAKKAKRADPGSGAQRCSIAYGEMPLASLPSLDISTDAITFGSKRLAIAETASNDASGKLNVLADAIEEGVKKSTAKDAPVVSLHGPIVLKPVDTTKMKLVTRAIASVLAAGDDFVLASQRGTDWSLLAPMPLPIVPVPLGTGGVWHNVKVPRHPSDASGSATADHVTLSVFVRKEAVDVEFSRMDGRESFVRDDQMLGKLAAELSKRKASPSFANRDDIEIAIEDDLTYADYVSVVRTAVAAGFTRWRFTEPGALAR